MKTAEVLVHFKTKCSFGSDEADVWASFYQWEKVLCTETEVTDVLMLFFSPEAQSSATMFDCLYIELSASLDHGTNELLEAAVRTARGDCVGSAWTDGDQGSGRRESLTSRAKRFLAGLVSRSYGRDRDRDRGRYREMSRHRGSKILRQKSRSCHDLSTL